MNHQSLRVIAAFILSISFVLLISCSKKPETKSVASVSPEMASDKKMDDREENQNGSPADQGGKQQPGQAHFAGGATKDNDNTPLGVAGFLPPQTKIDRLLEYQVGVNYKTSDFFKTRQLIYAIIAKRGFVRTSNATSGKPSSMNVQFAVRASDLFDVIKELDQVGDLMSESISTVDHTENMQQQRIKLRREDLRGNRRTNALIGDPASKNWADRESALERSEDAKDIAEMEQWRIQDRIQWASISISIEGPSTPAQIEVPQYRNAFTGLLNLFLNLVYYAIYLIPFAILGYGAFVAYRKVAARFKKT